MTKNVTDWCCAGCDKTWEHINNYPPLKFPTGEVDMSRYNQTRVIGVTYNRYCLECARAILSPEPEKVTKKWWQFWRTKPKLTPEEKQVRCYDLKRLTKKTLEKIYEQLPRR